MSVASTPTPADQGILRFKVKAGTDIRRLAMPITELKFGRLLDLIAMTYKAMPTALSYVDEDGDVITVATDADLFESMQYTGGDKLPMLNVSLAGSTNQKMDSAAGQENKTAPECAPEPPSEPSQTKSAPRPALGPLVEDMFIQIGMAARDIISNLNTRFETEEHPVVDIFTSDNDSTDPVHFNVICDKSGMHPIIGVRYHKIGEDYDLCAEEFAKLPQNERSAYEAIAFPGAPPRQCGLCQRQRSRHSCHRTRRRCIVEGELLPAAGFGFGSRGPGVAQLQHALIRVGLMDPQDIRRHCGFYGPRTVSGVCRLRGSLGPFDENSRTKLLELLKGADSHPNEEEPVEESSAPSATVDETSPRVSEPMPDSEFPASISPEVSESQPQTDVQLPASVSEDITVQQEEAIPSTTDERWASQVATLASMGFEATPQVLTALLDKHSGFMERVIAELIGQ